ncbi:MULE transposase [Hirsutella rhossiliensis]|uniref:MULE transposase domain-containing protein n=1 Tax=Hirsutella rhossiliensis TaxID=111463 RepID=A0A9P8NA83_9HYPO|nr:MULE transposase domain-containing protein [Hirsutella rhossiliensis]KAH0968846.1 MULE transposase domain-containing protein [Hirsutella rhossiliensis]
MSTDYDAAARAALATAFPGTQLQLCTWHINKNIMKHSKRLWVGDFNDDGDERPILQEAAEAGHDPGRWRRQGAAKVSPSDFLKAFKTLMYAPNDEEFNTRWEGIKTDLSEQQRLLQIVENTYLPQRRQWAQPWRHITIVQSSEKPAAPLTRSGCHFIMKSLRKHHIKASSLYEHKYEPPRLPS